LLLPVHAWGVDLARQPVPRRSLSGQPPQEAPQVRDYVLQRRATDSSGDLLNECLQLTRRQLPETHGRPPGVDELQKLGDSGQVVCNRPGSKPAKRRQVLLISRELSWSFGCGLAGKKTALLKVHLEDAGDGGEIRIIERVSRRTDLTIRPTERREGAETAAKPPPLQSTSGAQMATNRDSRVTAGVQPACKGTQDRAEQS
jgi:hypothetical protein